VKAVSVVIFIALCGPALSEPRVVDGDTLEIDGTIYRLNGIDAPEHGQFCGAWACGSDATAELVEIVKGHDITCDALGQDGFDRTIATCYADGTDIGAAMIDKGMAWAFVRYSDAYVDVESAARESRRGVFSGDFTAPWDYRSLRWTAALTDEDDAPEGCPIKGNISKNGHIYHPPWSPWYPKTRIDLSEGERWFCSEAEAVAAGWRAPRWN